MPNEEELIAERKRKLKDIYAQNVNPYPYSFDAKQTSKEVNETFGSLKPEEHTKSSVKVAGRIIGLRRIGKVTFMHLLDEQGKVQRPCR